MSYSLPKSRPPPLTPTPVSGYKHGNAVSDGGNATRICLSAHLCGETPTFQPPSQTALLPPCARLVTWRGRSPAPYGPSCWGRPRSPSAALVAPGSGDRTWGPHAGTMITFSYWNSSTRCIATQQPYNCACAASVTAPPPSPFPIML